MLPALAAEPVIDAGNEGLQIEISKIGLGKEVVITQGQKEWFMRVEVTPENTVVVRQEKQGERYLLDESETHDRVDDRRRSRDGHHRFYQSCQMKSQKEVVRMSDKPKFVIFAHNATYDKLHQVATLGLTAAAMGKDVIVILLFWTIKKLAEGKIDIMDFPSRICRIGRTSGSSLQEKKVPEDF